MSSKELFKPTRREFLSAAGATTTATVIGQNPLRLAQTDTEASSSAKSQRIPMIDAHSHMLMDSDESGTKRQRVEDLADLDLEALFARMDEVGIEMFFSVVQETKRVWGEWTGTNKIIVDLQEKFPERFRGIFGAEALDKNDILKVERLEEFKIAARDHGIKGLWFGPPYQHIYANDKRIYPFYEAAVENDALVFFHHGGGIGGGGGPAYRAPLKYARPILLDDVVIDFPDLRIHVEHMAYPWTEELLALMKHAPNVYTDVCELFPRPTWLAWYLMMAKEYGVIDRVIWGSDYDVYWYDDYDFSRYFKKVEDETTWIREDLNKILERSGWPTLTQDEIAGILGGNARRLWKLE